MLQLPKDLVTNTNPHRKIKIDDCTIVESCMHNSELNDSAIIYQHELIYLVKGSLKIRLGNEQVEVNEKEALLLKKGVYFDFIKNSNSLDHQYQSILFFIQDSFVKDFFKHFQIDQSKEPSSNRFYYKISNNTLIDSYMTSLFPYFESPLSVNKEFIRLKTFELFFNLIEIDIKLFSALTDLNISSKKDLVEIMEDNFLKNLTIEDYALLANRSVSTFKREFVRTFGTTPHKWIIAKRLELAQKLLKNGVRKPSEVYLEVGFEDLSHFSKAFKKYFGILPSTINNMT